MIRSILLALAPLLMAGPVAAQHTDHRHMPGMQTPPAKPPAAKAKLPTRPKAAAPAPKVDDPHAGHNMAPSPDVAHPPTAHGEHHAAPAAPVEADHDMANMAPADPPEIPQTAPPPPPTDYAAERFYDRAAMDRARRRLRVEHGGEIGSKVMLDQAEYRSLLGPDGYAWDGEAWYGGDINRLVLSSEGEGVSGEGVESAELQALYSRAIGPYFNLQAGLRQDIRPRPSRTFVTAGLEGLASYWFEIGAAVFLSHEGELLARAQGTYDLRFTQRLILQPKAEINLAAQDSRDIGVGAGVLDLELGLRLRYEIRREFAPYVGVVWARRFGKTADFARDAGERADSTSLVVGVRAWF